MSDDNIVSAVQSMEKRGDAMIVDVAVRSPINTPSLTKELRAQARALLASGTLPTAKESISQLAMGEVERWTQVQSSRPAEQDEGVFDDPVPVLGKLLETKIYKVKVIR